VRLPSPPFAGVTTIVRANTADSGKHLDSIPAILTSVMGLIFAESALCSSIRRARMGMYDTIRITARQHSLLCRHRLVTSRRDLDCAMAVYSLHDQRLYRPAKERDESAHRRSWLTIFTEDHGASHLRCSPLGMPPVLYLS
jgi:hypothetical protein